MTENRRLCLLLLLLPLLFLYHDVMTIACLQDSRIDAPHDASCVHIHTIIRENLSNEANRDSDEPQPGARSPRRFCWDERPRSDGYGPTEG